MVSRLLRLGVSNGRSSAGDETAVGELEMELALLREENARLKVERHRPPDSGRIIERMRDLGCEQSAEGAAPPEGTGQAIAECLALHESLIDACQEVQQAMQGIRSRLGALSVDLQDGVEGRARPNPIAVADAQELELAVEAQASSNLAPNSA